MMISRRSLLGAVPTTLALAACTRDLPPGPPPEVTRSPLDWPLPGRDYANTRAVLSSTIERSTVDRLGEAWSAPLPGGSVWGNAATTPIVVDDTVYLQDLESNVHALDRRSGAAKWVRAFDVPQIGPNGVAVGWGMVFAGTGGTDVTAMDAGTGEVRWTRTLPSGGTESVGIQPQVVDGKVLVATAPVSLDAGPYVGGGRGALYALDALTGRALWSFDTVEDDLWGNPEVNSGGGAWFPPAVDTERNRVHWGIGNPAPFPGTAEFPNGSSRPGPNLYTNSVVTLSLGDGTLDWYRQASPHDLFDHDLMLTMLVEGRERRIVVATGKAGRVIGHDAESGEVLWDTRVGLHRNSDLTELDGPTEVLPGGFGGVISPPAVAEGLVYLAVVNLPMTYSPDTTAYEPPELGQLPGALVAVDVRNGEIAWETEVDGDPMGGALVVSDLVLTSTIDGTLRAFDRSDGSPVWTFDAAGGTNGWPCLAHDTILWPIGLGAEPRLLALGLDGRTD